jgi:tRNA-modifying protein YgfZ
MMAMNPEVRDYRTLTEEAGAVELVDWNFLSLSGRDRQRLLHNFCTANINQLPLGRTTEAFILNDKGKTLWFGNVFALPEELFLCGASPIAEPIRTHLEKYIIREDVQVLDQSSSMRAVFVTGREAQGKLAECLSELSPSLVSLPNRAGVLRVDSGTFAFTVANVELAGWGWLFVLAYERADEFISKLGESEIGMCSLKALNRLRIEQLTPWYGRDLDDANLPQELNRDDKAISFTKGCYLGQETVARIDALGHVNQILVGMECHTRDAPQVGCTIEHNGKKVGRITSVAPTETHFIALGYIRRELALAGNRFPLGEGSVIVR